MRIDKANSDPFYRFLRFCEEFNRNIKVAHGALQLLATEASENAVEIERQGITLLPTGGEPWGEFTKWRSIAAHIAQSKKFLSQVGLVLVMSGFEDFLIGVKAEYDRGAEIMGEPAASAGKRQNECSTQHLTPLLAQLKWEVDAYDFLLPLLEYFTIVRNCVVHRAGRASASLIKQAQSSELTNCLSAWPRRRGKSIPSLPIAEMDEEIPLLPRHAVLAVDVCFRAASLLNSKLCKFLGRDGIVYMAAYHTLIDDDPIATAARKSPEKIINHSLGERYRVLDLEPSEAVGILQRLNKWENCIQRYQQLHPKTVVRK